VGWAADGPGSCEIVARTSTGDLLARGFAGRDRPDLLVLGLGRSNFAFRIAIPNVQSPTSVHVFASGVELSNSPLTMGPGCYCGDFSIAEGAVHGWVAECTLSDSLPQVRIIDQDGRVVAEAVAERDDLATDPHFLSRRFVAELDPFCFGRGELELRAAVGENVFASARCNLILKGNLEELRSDACSGWLFSPSAPTRCFEFEIRRNNVSLGVVRCQTPRDDVKALYTESTNPGFSKFFERPTTAAADGTSFSFNLPGSQAELFGGPFVIGSRPAVVAAARKVAGLSITLDHLSQLEQSILQTSIIAFLARARSQEQFRADHQSVTTLYPDAPRMSIIIPVYRDVKATKDCIESVLGHRVPQLDRVVLVNDSSPDPDMEPMLRSFSDEENVFILNNPVNRGFIVSVNIGFSFCRTGDVVLLNSDTRVFRGGLDEMWQVGRASKSVGTVTALSNNATIFSYPHPSLAAQTLDDVSWERVAEVALEKNVGRTVDVPTGHGFCMLVKREVLQYVDGLDEHFGRGYGEENDLCARAADLGFRNVLASAVFVEHKESLSFLDSKQMLLKTNIPLLEARYPEYTSTIMEFERLDSVRQARWPLDIERLNSAGAKGKTFALVVRNGLKGGSSRAISDIEGAVGYGSAVRLTLSCRSDGFLELSCSDPIMRSLFAPDEVADLFTILSATSIVVVLVHQLLGYDRRFLNELAQWMTRYHTVFYAHDFYSLCPRTTMIDATERFCEVADVDRCARCVTLGGTHEWSRLDSLTPLEHRSLFSNILRAAKHVVAPSEDAADYLSRAFPGLQVLAIPHPEDLSTLPATPRDGTHDEIVILGAIGSHKGSAKLYEIAQRAILTHPVFRFRVIGHTDIDEQLLKLGNVDITGEYKREDLDRLCRESRGRIALFLSIWPETYSYTLSEAVSYGFVPVVPDIGALAERVRRSGFGVIFPFPIDAQGTLECLNSIRTGEASGWRDGETPRSYQMHDTAIAASQNVLRWNATRRRQAPGPRSNTR
jgi:GT2 family glycosyltransferase/glycosyltransferase involved in cell wall biosynthesis